MSDAIVNQPSPWPDGHLRVSDRERDDTIDLLAEAATDGRLTLDEYSDRTDQALRALTRNDLATLTRDLESIHGGSVAASDRRSGSSMPVERLFAIFGSEIRRGRWPVPARLDSRAIFGECKIELQDASLHSRVTVLDVRAIFGSVEILVPDGVDVRLTGMSIFGSRSCHVRHAPPGAPIVEVRGRAIFGGITVRRPGWKEGVRKAIGGHLDRNRH